MSRKNPKICVSAPGHAYQYYGGGEVLLDKTVEYLKKAGADITLFDPWKDKVEDYDIMHFFGIGYFNYELLRTVKSKGCKLVLTPTFPCKEGIANFLRKTYHCACFMLPMLKTPPVLMRRNAKLADALLSSSEMEKKQLSGLLKADPGKISVVRYGADRSFLDSSPDLFISNYKVKDFILCVARFDSVQKNQLNLIRALRDCGLQMVFVGRPDKGMEGYYAQCRKEAPQNTIFIDYLEQGSRMLGSCYAACRVLVVPSKFEYPGLSAMEASLAGCDRLALTGIGSAKEYYKDYARYFNPYSLNEIKSVVMERYNSSPAAGSAREYFSKNHLWENYALNVISVYKRLI